MNQFDRLIQIARNKALKKGSNKEPSFTIIREPSKNETSKPYHPPNWGILFCPHDRSYFDTCPHCKRDRKRAQLEFEMFCKRRGITV